MKTTADIHRFAFGANWRAFLRVVDDERIDEAERSIRELLAGEDLTGRRVLDIGCGSGLFSLAALRLGATEVHSIDVDPSSVACTQEMRRRAHPQSGKWTIDRGDVTDIEAMRALGTYDLVYAWGVLHHTGALWTALQNACAAVGPNGRLVVSVYNDQGRMSRVWSCVKRIYNRLPRSLRTAYAVAVMVPFEARSLLKASARGRPAAYIQSWTRYQSNRGMSRWHDLIDWVGGWPFEVAGPDEVFGFCRDRGLVLERMKTAGGGPGCNEFVFRRE
jgi:2-polyprenyl-6-hydroxyphenyl methylase/3-demethylubiquinone-9 3-methyltransferase